MKGPRERQVRGSAKCGRSVGSTPWPAVCRIPMRMLTLHRCLKAGIEAGVRPEMSGSMRGAGARLCRLILREADGIGCPEALVRGTGREDQAVQYAARMRADLGICFGMQLGRVIDLPGQLLRHGGGRDALIRCLLPPGDCYFARTGEDSGRWSDHAPGKLPCPPCEGSWRTASMAARLSWRGTGTAMRSIRLYQAHRG